MIMKKTLAFLLFITAHIAINAQVGFGTNNPDPSAAVEIQDSTRGLLIPRMDLIHKNSIQNPATGLMIYQTDSIKGFWYYDGLSWRQINGGKRTIVLTDTITNIGAQTKISLEFGANTEEIVISGCSFLTSLDLSMVTNLTSISFSDNPVLTSINLANLKTCDGNFRIVNCLALNNLNLSSLERLIGNNNGVAFYLRAVGLTALNIPKVKRIMGSMSIEKNPALTSLSFPLLYQLDNFQVTLNPVLTTISSLSMQKIGFFQFMTNDLLSVVSFPALTDFYGIDEYSTHIWESPNLTSVVIGNLTSFKNYEFFITGGQLNSNIVNTLLHNFVTITPPLTNKRFYVAAQTPAAPPTGQGLIDKATLQANGNTVITD